LLKPRAPFDLIADLKQLFIAEIVVVNESKPKRIGYQEYCAVGAKNNRVKTFKTVWLAAHIFCTSCCKKVYRFVPCRENYFAIFLPNFFALIQPISINCKMFKS
jgi:hypothetical protein